MHLKNTKGEGLCLQLNNLTFNHQQYPECPLCRSPFDQLVSIEESKTFMGWRMRMALSKLIKRSEEMMHLEENIRKALQVGGRYNPIDVNNIKQKHKNYTFTILLI